MTERSFCSLMKSTYANSLDALGFSFRREIPVRFGDRVQFSHGGESVFFDHEQGVFDVDLILSLDNGK